MIRPLEKILLGIYLLSLPLLRCTYTKEEILVNTKNAQLVEVFYPSINHKPVGVYVVHDNGAESIEIPEWDIILSDEVIDGDTLDTIKLGDRRFMIELNDSTSSVIPSLESLESKSLLIEFTIHDSKIVYGDTLSSNLVFYEYLKKFF